jgi:integrase
MASARVAYKGTRNAVCRVKWADPLTGQVREEKVRCGCVEPVKPCKMARDLAKAKTAEIKRQRKERLPVTVLGIGAVLERWLTVKRSEVKGVTAARYASYASAWQRWWRELGGNAFADLSEDLLRRYKVGREEELRSRAGKVEQDPKAVERRVNKTMYGEMTALRQMFGWAISEGFWMPPANKPINFDPSRAVQRPRVTRGVPQPLSEAEKDALLAAVASNPRLNALACLALYAGARREGALGLRVGDVDLDRGVLVLREKNAKERQVDMGPRLIAALRGCPPADGLFWFGEPTMALLNDFSAVFCSLLRQVTGRRGVRYHHLRHTFATRFLAAHPDELATLQDLMGHASPETTRVYTKVSNERRRAALLSVPE